LVFSGGLGTVKIWYFSMGILREAYGHSSNALGFFSPPAFDRRGPLAAERPNLSPAINCLN